MPTIALTSKIARQPKAAKAAAKKPAAKAAKLATEPVTKGTLVCACCGKTLKFDKFNVDRKYPKHGLRNTFCVDCCKAYRADKKAAMAAARIKADDVEPIAVKRSRRSATIPTPADVPQPVADSIDHVNQVLDACAA